MSNPWDRPPLLKLGDDNENITYAFVGRIITRWEAIEFELSRLNSCFAGAPDEQAPIAVYGKGTIFRQRAEILARSADGYFITVCDQKKEADFARLLEQAKGFADRRNDIAHGILFQIEKLTFFRDRIRSDRLSRAHYAIIPPLYALRWHSTGFPDFAYSSHEMSRLLGRLESLHLRIEKYRLAL